MPVAGAKDDRYNACLAPFVALHRAIHLDVIAVVGGEKVGADQEQHDVGGVQMIVDLAVEVLAGSNSAIVPSRNYALPEEAGKVLLEFVAQGFVRMRVGDEDVGHG